jgi:hypothetical protein
MSTAISNTSVPPAHRSPLLDADEVAKVLRVTPRHVLSIPPFRGGIA